MTGGEATMNFGHPRLTFGVRTPLFAGVANLVLRRGGGLHYDERPSGAIVGKT
jgi:hypothetical protein